MRKLHWILGAFLAGEVATLFYKDEKFKKNFAKANGGEKIALLWDGIVELNKKIFFDVKDFNYEGSMQDFKKTFEKEKQLFEKKYEEIKSNIGKLTKEDILPMIEELQEKLYNLKDKAEDMIDDIKEKYDIDEKIEVMLKKIKEIKNKI